MDAVPETAGDEHCPLSSQDEDRLKKFEPKLFWAMVKST